MSELNLKSDFTPKALADWHTLVTAGPRGVELESLNRYTEDRIQRGPLLQAESVPLKLTRLARSELPLLGERDWHMAAPVRHPDTRISNAQLLEDLTGGASAVRFETGARTKHPKDLKRLLEGVHTNLVPIQFAPAADNTESFEAAVKLESLQAATLWSGLNPIENSELLKASYGTAPNSWRLMGLSPADTHETGGTAKQELAVLAASLAEAMREHRAETVCQHIVIDLAATQDTHLTIAKFRAARRLIRRIAEAFGSDGSAIPLCAITSLRMMQSEDAWTNLLRVMSASIGAVIGGADMITARPFTDSLGQPHPLPIGSLATCS